MSGFCSKCGTQLADNVMFCPNCGAQAQSVQSIQNVQNVTPVQQFQPQQAQYFQPAPQPQQPSAAEHKGMSNLAAFLLALVVLAVGTTGFFAFKEDGFLRRDSDERSGSKSSTSEKEKSSKEKLDKKKDKAAEQKTDDYENTVNWNGELYGVELPAPEGVDKVYQRNDDLDQTIIYIGGVSYDEFREYCETLEGSPDWTPSDRDPPEDTAHFPDDYNDTGMAVYFTGDYKGTLHISVHYMNDDFVESTGMPHFEIIAREK